MLAWLLILGMGAVFVGIGRAAPMTYLCRDDALKSREMYARVIVPLMIANLVSLFISGSRLQHEPIYEVLAYQDGIHLPKQNWRSFGRTARLACKSSDATSYGGS